MPERYEYRVVEVRESMVGGKMSGGKLEKLLNDHASQGWQLKAITSADVKGRVGPGGTEGLLVTFERRRLGPSPPERDLLDIVSVRIPAAPVLTIASPGVAWALGKKFGLIGHYR